MNKNTIGVYITQGYKILKVGDFVRSTKEARIYCKLQVNIKMRIVRIVNESQVAVIIELNPQFSYTTEPDNKTGSTATVFYKQNELKGAQIVIDAVCLEKVPAKQRATPSFGF